VGVGGLRLQLGTIPACRQGQLQLSPQRLDLRCRVVSLLRRLARPLLRCAGPGRRSGQLAA
jgi:hypothetical protein